jgi:hypothetical protein
LSLRDAQLRGIEPRRAVVDVEQPSVREVEPLGCSVPLNVVDELLGGTVRVAWPQIAWLLAEQIDRHSNARTSLALGTHEAYRDWRP